ncbi:MAG: hypothetical protein RLZZ337_947 [Bacteroidota bacterium]|jgi:PKD repeat protein
MKSVLVFTIALFTCFASYSQCDSAYIEVSDQQVYAPQIVQFKLVNVSNVTSFKWNTGKGTVVGADTVYTCYDKAIIINAFVEITLTNGSKCTVRKDSAVIIHDKPTPQYALSRNKLCYGPDTITLFDYTPNSKSRSWVVDGTSYSNVENAISHNFVSVGKKDISLIVTDSNGCQAVRQFDKVVDVYPNLKFLLEKAVNHFMFVF